MRRHIREGLLATLAAAAILAAGCEDATPTPTTPTDPVLRTENFAGTLTINGAVTFPFSVSSSGPITATLASVSDAAIPIGLSLGTWNGISCEVVIARDGAIQGDRVIGEASNFGNLCARVYDIGQLTASLTVGVAIEHP